MESVKTFYLRGRSGKHYRFYSFNEPGRFKKEGGVFIIARRKDDIDKTHHEVINIGETDDLSTLNDYILKGSESETDGNCVCARLEINALKRQSAIDDLKMGFSSGKNLVIGPGSEF